MDSPPHLLIVSAGASSAYREYLLASLSSRFTLSLVDHRVLPWASQYLSRHIVADILDDGTLEIITDLHAMQPVDGVLCWDELRIVEAAQVAEKLNLPTTPSSNILNCRDKFQTRLLVSQAHILQPRFALVSSVEEIKEVAKNIGFPAVVKPRALMASEGVTVVRNEDELSKAYIFATSMSPDRGDAYDFDTVLLESYVDGVEYAVDGYSFNGRYSPLFASRKILGFPPYCEEIGHQIVPEEDILCREDVNNFLKGVHECLGITNSMTHVELKMTSRGPALIEVNARLGGDLIPLLGYYATGIDAALVAGDIAVGVAPEASLQRLESAMIRFYYPPAGMRIKNVSLPSSNCVKEAGVLAESGDYVDCPPAQFVVGRVAYAIASGLPMEHLVNTLDDFGGKIRIDTGSI